MSNDLIIAARKAESLYGSMIMPFFSSTEMHLIAICKKAFSAIFPCCVKKANIESTVCQAHFWHEKLQQNSIVNCNKVHFSRKKDVIGLPTVIFTMPTVIFTIAEKTLN